MSAPLIIYLLILHFVSDFLMQSREMGEKKSSDLKFLLFHVLIIFSVFYLGLNLYYAFDFSFLPNILNLIFQSDRISPLNILYFCILNSVVHLVIDALIWNLYKLYYKNQFNKMIEADSSKLFSHLRDNFKYWKESSFYNTIGFDQLLHTATLIILGFIYLV
jgi:hypothetical protein